MKTFVRYSLLSATLAVLSVLAACAGYDPYERNNIGVMSAPNYFDKEIVIKPDTKSVIVSQRDVVKFTNSSNGKSFVWNFDTRSFSNFDLNRVAPDVLGAQHVIAYVYLIPGPEAAN